MEKDIMEQIQNLPTNNSFSLLTTLNWLPPSTVRVPKAPSKTSYYDFYDYFFHTVLLLMNNPHCLIHHTSFNRKIAGYSFLQIHPQKSHKVHEYKITFLSTIYFMIEISFFLPFSTNNQPIITIACITIISWYYG